MLNIENIILYCIKQLNGERTIYSIYHLLNGKKSSQTIQDAHLFSLKKFFRILESLTRESFDKIIEKIFEKKLIRKCGEQRFLLTPTGDIHLEKIQLPIYINGWSYQQTANLFWERLTLLVQVTSNLVFQETHYIPIQKNKEVHFWLKSTLKDFHVPRSEIGKLLFSELMDCFEEDKNIDPSFLVFRLTGYQKIGLTPLQMSQKFKINSIDYHIEFINVLHFLIRKVENIHNHSQLLPELLKGLIQDDSLTQSSRKTWVLLKQGYSIEQIAGFRRLKKSTIEDHIVEFALNVNDFSIDDYVDNVIQKRILEISQQTESKQLKLIRNYLEAASYFQIRLVLAKYGDRQWN
ncbi:YpbB family protein [Neobacillus ginsengisoli]|uniref:Uncharacterized protein YpbB n=1 Tax=Neobacillus ginsengisoli TaxID=904295 RepID=A0ABT9XQ14_9BACI|nr:helix-turn-helix domain-containing protein [Neobacillus ginsengisoli]MDQ0197461.1 uncharacterized protein YpbB [Neobacillus ginsengisoli]